MNSYSQAGQDLWVLEMLNYKTNGFFLDIGAYDGILFSNSYLLENKYNWTGILIEAHPHSFNQMSSCRNNICLNYAVSNQNGKVFFESAPGMGNKIVNQGIEIESITLETLFIRHNVPSIIDYMSLDIEGSEYQALEKFPFDSHKCLLITVEHNLYCNGPDNKNKIYHLLKNHGYKMLKENVMSENQPFEDWYVYDYI